MDARGRLDQIRQWATESEKRSGSPYVDERQQWIRDACDQLQAFADGVPNIIERRVGERRNVDRPDSEHPMRRVGGARRGGAVSTVPVNPVVSYVTFLTSPPGLTPTDTYQVSVRATTSAGDTVTGRTVTWATTNGAVFTINGSGLATAQAAGSAQLTATVDGVLAVDPNTGTAYQSISVTASATPDHFNTPSPASLALVDGGSTSTITIRVLDASNIALTGQTVTAGTSNASVATVSADDNTGDPDHVFTVTPAGVGTCTITISSGAITDATVSVNVATSTPSSAWLAFVADNYADITAAYADPMFSTAGGDKSPVGRFSLVAATGCATSTKAIRYIFPDRSANPCSAYGVTLRPNLPSSVTEIWIRALVKFDSNFTTDAGCANIGNQLKWVFGRVVPSSRFNCQVNSGTQFIAGVPNNEQMQVINIASSIFDNTWHDYRFHFKVGASGVFAMSMDGTTLINKVGGTAANNATSIYGTIMGDIINEGPPAATGYEWGSFEVWNSDPGWGI